MCLTIWNDVKAFNEHVNCFFNVESVYFETQSSSPVNVKIKPERLEN